MRRPRLTRPKKKKRAAAHPSPNVAAIPPANGNCAFFKLPQELLMQIASYLVDQGRTVEMEDGKVARERNRWNFEVERLRNPFAKRVKRKKFPEFLVACSRLYVAGVEAYWRGNTLSFCTTVQLERFLGIASSLAMNTVGKIAMFNDYEKLARDFSVAAYLATQAWASAHPTHGGAVLPPTGLSLSLSSLSGLPRLHSLHICTTGFSRAALTAATVDSLYGDESQSDPTSIRHSCILHELAPLYARDSLLKTIPPTVLANLHKLTIEVDIQVDRTGNPISFIHQALYPSTLDQRIEKKTFSILHYARDLSSGNWDHLPFAVDPATLTPERNYINDLWLEARAAVLFDPHIFDPHTWPAQTLQQMKKQVQWSTWAMEWGCRASRQHTEAWSEAMRAAAWAGVAFVAPQLRNTPRGFGELFEIVEGEVRVKDEVGWEAFKAAEPEKAAYYERENGQFVS